jgi:hypothetical protein
MSGGGQTTLDGTLPLHVKRAVELEEKDEARRKRARKSKWTIEDNRCCTIKDHMGEHEVEVRKIDGMWVFVDTRKCMKYAKDMFTESEAQALIVKME